MKPITETDKLMWRIEDHIEKVNGCLKDAQKQLNTLLYLAKDLARQVEEQKKAG